MNPSFLVACIQLNSKRDIETNIPEILELVEEALGLGAEFITLPECTGMMEPNRELLLEKTPYEQNHRILSAISERALKSGAWILIGSLAIRLSENQIVNRSYLINGKGEIAAKYDKIHMFDVQLDDGQVYRESEIYKPGTEAILTELPWGRLGLTICYDVRFPYLYRTLAQNGAQFITIPSAFTKLSGEAHWHVLQRARAIETGCYIISAAQCGDHAEGRQTFGHSLVVDPWGNILADGGEETGVIVVKIDPLQVNNARAKIPALTHDKRYKITSDLRNNDNAN